MFLFFHRAGLRLPLGAAWAIATLLVVCALPGVARAASPSFPCAQATVPVDRAICADAELSDLDVVLEKTFRAALAADPVGREETLRAQRAWLKGRADACHLPRQGQATKDQTACLVRITKDRIVILQPGDPRDVILAMKIADAIRRWNGGAGNEGSLAIELGKDPDSPVRFASGGEPLTAQLAAKLPPVDGPFDMRDQGAVYRFGDDPSTIAIASVQGTANCWSYTIFHRAGARYETVADPDPANEGHCGETISFGSTSKGAGEEDPPWPLFADVVYSVGKPTLLVLAYHGKRWRRVGRFALDFETALSMTHRSCEAQAPCDELAAAALQLARARDAAGPEAPDRLGVAARTTAMPENPPEDLPQFGGSSFDAWSTFESGAPVYRPATAGGVAMRISHGTIGWRINEDYVVAAYRADGKDWHPIAGFQISKKRVKLRSVSVE